jgi:hypothetical protein
MGWHGSIKTESMHIDVHLSTMAAYQPVGKGKITFLVPCPRLPWACFFGDSHAHASVSMAPNDFFNGLL